MCTCLKILLIAVWEEYRLYYSTVVVLLEFSGVKLLERLSLDYECERLSLDCECVLKIPSLFGSILDFVVFLHKQNVGKWIGLLGVGIYHCVFSYMASVIFGRV